MSMSDGELELVKAEAQRVLADVKAVQADRKRVEQQRKAYDSEDFRYWRVSEDLRLTSALRRHSMDLTRALARLRRAS